MINITGYIYRYINMINGKVYIGQTFREQERKIEHINESRNGSKFAFHCAIRKYGIESFEYAILHKIESRNNLYVRAKMNELEIKEIMAHDSFGPHGYNMTPGGEGADNGEYVKKWAQSEEGKERIKIRSRDMKNREPFVELTCKHCGNDYLAKTRKSKFCSKKCRNDWNNENKIYANTYDVEGICEWCGNIFVSPKHDNRKCCSYSCAAKLRHSNK